MSTQCPVERDGLTSKVIVFCLMKYFIAPAIKGWGTQDHAPFARIIIEPAKTEKVMAESTKHKANSQVNF